MVDFLQLGFPPSLRLDPPTLTTRPADFSSQRLSPPNGESSLSGPSRSMSTTALRKARTAMLLALLCELLLDLLLDLCRKHREPFLENLGLIKLRFELLLESSNVNRSSGTS